MTGLIECPPTTENFFSVLMNAELKSLLVFVAVVDTGNLFCASHVLGCSQPAVSIHLKRVRSLFAKPLFTREGRNLLPTPYAIKLSNELKGHFNSLHNSIVLNCKKKQRENNS